MFRFKSRAIPKLIMLMTLKLIDIHGRFLPRLPTAQARRRCKIQTRLIEITASLRFLRRFNTWRNDYPLLSSPKIEASLEVDATEFCSAVFLKSTSSGDIINSALTELHDLMETNRLPFGRSAASAGSVTGR